MRILFLSLLLFSTSFYGHAQVQQVNRYEMEKKNTDDFFTVLPAGKYGLVIIRDTNRDWLTRNKTGGDNWEITALDTTFQDLWHHELSIDYGYVFKGYDLTDRKLYMLFRDGEMEKNDYHIIQLDIPTGEIERYDIENELALRLSHLTVVEDHIIFAGYIRNSPTVVSYEIGSKKLEVIPGFFKDRSDVIDLRTNDNGTFNVLTLEKEYEGFFVRYRTYAKGGTILFERAVDLKDDIRILSGKSTDFIDGNLAMVGSYGGKSSYYSRGIYFAIIKPEGQENIINRIDFTEIEHFFDYMRPKRAERIKNKIIRKNEAGKDYKYPSRILMHEVQPVSDGFLITGEIYDPKYDRMIRPEYTDDYFNPAGTRTNPTANYGYVRQPSQLVNSNEVNHYEYLQTLILKLDKNGQLVWNESFVIDEVESASLEPVVDLTVKHDSLYMLYRMEEQLSYKVLADQDTSFHEKLDIKLKYPNDELKYNYDLIGGTHHWYDKNFFIWGYHKVENKTNSEVDKRRNVLFINKIRFD